MLPWNPALLLLGSVLGLPLTAGPPPPLAKAPSPSRSASVARGPTVFTNPADFRAATPGLGAASTVDFDELDAAPFVSSSAGRTPFDGGAYRAKGISFANPRGNPLFLAPGGLFWNLSNSLSVGSFPSDTASSKPWGDDDALTATLSPPCKAVGLTLIRHRFQRPDEFIRFTDASGSQVVRVSFPENFAPYRAFVGVLSADRPIAQIEVAEVAGDRDDVSYDDFVCLGRAEPADFFGRNPSELITLRSPADVAERRDRLVRFIWGHPTLPEPQLLPDTVQEAIAEPRYAHLPNLKQVNRLVAVTEGVVTSVMYHFVPLKANNHLFIHHQGHDGDFFLDLNVVGGLLDQGYSVIAMFMPLWAPNNQPVVQNPRFGKLKIQQHDQLLRFVPVKLGHALKFFLNPVALAVNYARNRDYDPIYMIGISGGGWTTTLYAALDPRVLRSYPVAGTLPLALRTSDWGDDEDHVVEFYDIADYLELYILGGYGDGRAQLQVLNQYDSCCYGGVRYWTYEAAVRDRLATLGKGSFEVFLDDSHQSHKISSEALRRILENAAQTGGPPR